MTTHCNACQAPLLPSNLLVDDGCPCNSPRGVNFPPQPCIICRVDNCVKPGHRFLPEDTNLLPLQGLPTACAPMMPIGQSFVFDPATAPQQPCQTCGESLTLSLVIGAGRRLHCTWCGDKRTIALRLELEEMNALFELRHGADMRAITRWRAEEPFGRDLRQPDQADLCVWLMDKLDAAEGELASIKHVDPGVGNSRGE